MPLFQIVNNEETVKAQEELLKKENRIAEMEQELRLLRQQTTTKS